MKQWFKNHKNDIAHWSDNIIFLLFLLIPLIIIVVFFIDTVFYFITHFFEIINDITFWNTYHFFVNIFFFILKIGWWLGGGIIGLIIFIYYWDKSGKLLRQFIKDSL